MADLDTGSNTTILYNDLHIFDTVLQLLTIVDVPDPPLPRSYSTATLLPDGRIVYIGGFTQSASGNNISLHDMRNISVFNTVNYVWSLQTADLANLTTVSGRVDDQSIQDTTYPDYLKLNVTRNPFQFSLLNTHGDKPPQLSFHIATLYNNYMVVAFGKIGSINNNLTVGNASPGIYILDLPSSTWMNIFIPVSYKSAQSAPSAKNYN
ncbi:4002_t:CDS:2, partial [Dentiscutata erythropus]